MGTVRSKGRAMAKVGRPKKPDGEGGQARIDRDILKMAKLVANHAGTDTRAYLSKILRPAVIKDYRKMIEDLDSKSEGKGT